MADAHFTTAIIVVATHLEAIIVAIIVVIAHAADAAGEAGITADITDSRDTDSVPTMREACTGFSHFFALR